MPEFVDDIETPLPASVDYLADCNKVRTSYPLISAPDSQYFMDLFGLSGTIENDIFAAPTKKTRGAKQMSLTARINFLDQVIQLSLTGSKVEMHAVIKKPHDAESFHLDALQVIRHGACDPIPCCKSSIERACLEDVISCFREAVTSLRNDPTGQKSDIESTLSANIKRACDMMTISYTKEITNLPLLQP